MRNGWAFGVAAVVLAHAPSAWADDGLRLVELVAPRTFDRGSHDLTFPAPVAASTQYFLTVERSGAVGHVELNGQVVVRPDDLVGPGGELLRVGVPLRATNNGLKVKVSGPRSLTLSIQGIVPSSALPPSTGKRVAHLTLYSASFSGDRPARGHTAAVSVPTTSGLFALRVEQTGPAPANTAGVQWNGVSVLGVVPLSPARSSADGPVVVRASNVLKTSVLGPQDSRVTVTLSGWIVDETAPTVSWDELPTELEPTTPLRATFSDATSGIAAAEVKILLDESQDVTAAFTVGMSEATSTVAALEALAPTTAVGIHTLTAVVTDRAGLAAQASLRLVRDRPPVLTTPDDLTVEQTSPAGSVVSFTVTAVDDLDPSPVVECAPPSGSVFVAGTTTVTCTARDSAGNVRTATFGVTVRDTTPPALGTSPDLIVEQTSPAGAVVSYTVAATDAVDSAPIVECAPASGDVFPAGTTTVTCTARDAAGNVSSTTFSATVRDSTPPTLVPSVDLVVEQTSPAGAVVGYTVTASDAVDEAPIVECTPASGSVFAAGATTVTCTARDAAGNTSAATFTVIVRDTTRPVLETPGDLIVEQASPAGAAVVYSVTATDAVDAAPALECTPSSGDVFAAGTTTVTCTARDTAGNVSTATFTVTVRDSTPPVLATPADLVVELTSAAGAVVTYTVTASDAVDPAPVIECTPPSGDAFAAGTTTVTCTARDIAGNVGTATFTVTVRDTTPPVLVAPDDQIVEQTSPVGAIVTFTATASDAVDPSPVVECVPASGSTFAAGTTTVTCTARDAAGNTSTTTFFVTVQDTTPPTATLSPGDGALVTVARVPVTLTFADSGSGVSTESAAITVDGNPLVLTVMDAEARGLTEPLSVGFHVLTAELLDRAGHPLSLTSTFEVALPDLVAADHLDLPPARSGGGSSTATLLVSNASPRVPLHLSAAVATGDFVVDPPLPSWGAVVLPGASLTLVVRFAPSDLGPATGTLELASNDPGEPKHTIALAGAGTRGTLELSLDPGPPENLPAGSAHRVRVRAVDATGATDVGFRGLVELRASPEDSVLNGVLLLLGDDRGGVATTPPLLLFSAPGSASITAHLVVGADAFPLGTLAVNVVTTDRGHVTVSLDSGTYGPGQTLTARVFVDMGTPDGSAVLGDTLGAYDLRLLFDPRRFEVVRVDPGTSVLGPPLFVLPGSVRLMGLNDTGTLTNPAGPSLLATGIQEIAQVVLRVRPDAPAGEASFGVVADALTTAEAANEGDLSLSPVGDPGPRLGEVDGAVTISSPRPAPSKLALLGSLPRPGEGLVAHVQRTEVVRAVLSEPVDPDTLSAVSLLLDGVLVAGTAQLGDRPNEIVFVPASPLGPGEYTVQLDASLTATGGAPLTALQTSTFRVGPAPEPVPADLDQDGELAVLDVQARRDVVIGRTPGELPDFPPLFLTGGPGSLTLHEGEATTVLVRVVDLDGTDVLLAPDELPVFAHLTRLSFDTFELSLDPLLAGSGGQVVKLPAYSGGAVNEVELTLEVEHVNTPPTLVLVEPVILPIVVRERGPDDGIAPFELVFEARDADLTNPDLNETLTFAVKGEPIRNMSAHDTSARPDQAIFKFAPDHDQAGTYELVLEVTDAAGEKATLTLPIEVKDVNRPPELTRVTPMADSPTVLPGERVVVEWTATDPDGDPVEIALGSHAFGQWSETDIAREIELGNLRLDVPANGVLRGTGSLRIELTVLRLISRGVLSLAAVASDGKALTSDVFSFGNPSIRIAPFSALNLGMVPVALDADPDEDRHVSRPFESTIPNGTFLGVTIEIRATGQPLSVDEITASIVSAVQVPRRLAIRVWFSGRLTFSEGVAAGYDLAVRMRTTTGQVVTHRTPISFVNESMRDWGESANLSGSAAAPLVLGPAELAIERLMTLPVTATGEHLLEGRLSLLDQSQAPIAIHRVELTFQTFTTSETPEGETETKITSEESLVDTGPFFLDAEGTPAGWRWEDNLAAVAISQLLHLEADPNKAYMLVLKVTGRTQRLSLSTFARAGLEATFTGVLKLAGVAGPELTLVSASPQPGAPYVQARVRVTEAHAIRRFLLRPTGAQPLGFAATEPAPTDPRDPLLVDFLFRPDQSELRLVGEYQTVTATGDLATQYTRELVIPTPLLGTSSRLTVNDSGYFRPRPQGDGSVRLELEPVIEGSVTILPPGARPEDQLLDGPYAHYFATATGLAPEDVVTQGAVYAYVDGTTPLTRIPHRAASELGMPLSANGRLTTDYRISPPIFFVFGSQPTRLDPVRFLHDRVVVSIDRFITFDDYDLDVIEAEEHPLPGIAFGSEFLVQLQLLNRGVPTTFLDYQQYVLSTGLKKVSCQCHSDGSEHPREESLLESALVGCEDTVECWFPFPVGEKERYSLYLDDEGKAPVKLTPTPVAGDIYDLWRNAYPVHDLLTAYPDEFTPGQHRVRLYLTPPQEGAQPMGPPLLEATFQLAIAERALPFKTDFDHPASLNCPGASPDDLTQRDVRQGDSPLDDEEAPCTPKAGGTVLLATGEEILERVDMVIPGCAGLDFVFRRCYRSKESYSGPLGYNWDSNWNDSLYFPTGDRTDPSRVIRKNGRTHVAYWERLSKGRYAAPEGYFGTLIREPTQYVLRQPDGRKHVYDLDGRLVAIEDRYKNTIEIRYDTVTRQIDCVLDTYQRKIDFTFEQFDEPQTDPNGDPPPKVYRLVSLRDFAGREVIFTYGPRGDLEAVRAPLVAGEGHRTERYEYWSGSGDRPDLEHNLIGVTSPAEGSSPATQTITYGTNRGDRATYDKVVEEFIGGTNASGVMAGGLRKFDYSSGRFVHVFEPNGTRHTHEIDSMGREVSVRQQGSGGSTHLTKSSYNENGLLVLRVHPEGNEEHFVYGSGPRAAHRYIVEHRRTPGPRGGGPDLVTRYMYEPVYHQLAAVTDPRGFTTGWKPALGSVTPGRYTTTIWFDYQESAASTPIPEASRFGIDTSFYIAKGSIPFLRGGGAVDLNGDDRTDQFFGNAVRTTFSVLLEDMSSQEVITETRWNDHGLPTAVIDPVGNVTTYRYFGSDDPDGDGRKVQDVTSTAERGYLREVTVDANAASPRRSTDALAPLALSTSYGYDAVGNVSAVVDPEGVKTSITCNAANEVIEIIRAATAVRPDHTALRLATRVFYDLNGRVTTIETGVENGPTETRRTFVHDIMGNVVASSVLASSTKTLTTRYIYDENGWLEEVASPLGFRTHTTYDGRGLPLTITRGYETSKASTLAFEYDGNGNRTAVLDPDTNGDGQSDRTTFTYDGFDRLFKTTDALGTETTLILDPLGLVVQQTTSGRVPNLPVNVPLQLQQFSRDELGRVFHSKAALFVTPGATLVRPAVLADGNHDGFVSAKTAFDAASRPVVRIDDDDHRTKMTYDGASRPYETIDPFENAVTRKYDRNGNLSEVITLERSPEGLVTAPESYTTRYVYDAVNRMVRASDNAGQTTRWEYDSRGNMTLHSDPEGSLIADPLDLERQINGPGNTRTYVYDGADRLVQQVVDLREDGTGASNVVGQITLSFTHDDDSRLTHITDDNDRTTSFQYDALGRRTSQILANGAAHTYEYDDDDNVTEVTDPNGTVVTRTYDVLNRLVEVSVSRGAGVLGTSSELYRYDGLGRLVQAFDDNGLGDYAMQTVDYVYDSLGRVVEERQNDAAVSSQYHGDGTRAKVVYPGQRAVLQAFDPLNRVKLVQDGTQANLLASFDWIGPGLRELRRKSGSPQADLTTSTYLKQGSDETGGYDAAQRVVRKRVLGPSGTPLVERLYEYGRAGQRLSERRTAPHEHGLADHYTYDSAYRIVASAFDRDGEQGAPRRDLSGVSYRLDDVGNRLQVDKATAVGTSVEAYVVNAVNQYVRIGPVDTPPRSYDRNGNLTSDGAFIYSYDYKNRLVGVARSSGTTAVPIAIYRYLPDGRRAAKSVFEEVAPGQVVLAKATAFYWDGIHEIEERDAQTNMVEATYVWAPGHVDDLLQMRRERLGATFYPHHDARGNVVAITDSEGRVVERIRYDDFGNMEVRDSTGQVVPQSMVGLEYGFQGRRHDPETGLIYFRARYYDPQTGRFISRDPVWDPNNMGNAYTFVGNNPATLTDPSGMIEPVTATLILLAAGAAIFGGQEAIVQANTATNYDFRAIGRSAAGGAVVGVSAAIPGVLAARLGVGLSAGRLAALTYGGDAVAGVVGQAGSDIVGGQGMSSLGHYAFAAALGPALRGAFTGAERFLDDVCFLAGAQIETDHGMVSIEDIQVGDRVLSRDPTSGDQAFKPVTRLFRGQTEKVAHVRVDDARPATQRGRTERHRVGTEAGESSEGGEPDSDPDQGQTLRCTPEHPFWVSGRGWVPAGELRDGDHLLGSKGEDLQVVGVDVREEKADRYNFEVGEYHSYFVAGELNAPAVWVHNTCKILVDNNVAGWIAEGTPEAMAFAQRYSGRLRISGTVATEFKRNRGANAMAALEQAGVRRLRGNLDASVRETQAFIRSVGRDVQMGSSHWDDMRILATARKNSMGLITADTEALYTAARGGINARGGRFTLDLAVNADWEITAAEALQRRGYQYHRYIHFITPFD